MEIKITRKVGDANAEFLVDEKEPERALEMLTFLGVKDFCPLPGFLDATVKWQTRRAKGKDGTPKAGQEFLFVERVAYSKDGRRATSGMGRYLSGGLYWKQWEEWTPKENEVEM